MKYQDVEVSDVILIGAFGDLDNNRFQAIKMAVELLEEANPKLHFINPFALVEDMVMDSKMFSAKEIMRKVSSHIAYTKCVITADGWEKDHMADVLVKIARHLQIPVIPFVNVHKAIQDGESWFPG